MNWWIEQWKNLEGIQLRLTQLLICFFFFGAVGINLPPTRSLFEPLSWLTLLYAFVAMMWSHQHVSYRLLIALFFSFAVGMAAEAVGVKTGKIFGSYVYTDVLGWQLFAVPVIIGVNWVSLGYSTNNVSAKFFTNKWLAAIAAAAMMTALDVLIEPLAIRHHFWIWTADGFPPLQNFVAWFLISLPISLVYQFLAPRKFNFTALVFLLALVFFLWVDFCVSYFEQQF